MTTYSRAKLTKLMAVRFTDQEFTRLQEAAEDQGIGPSTLVRILVNQALNPAIARRRRMTSDEFREVMVSTLTRLDKTDVDSFFKEISVGTPDDPALLLWAGKTKEWEEFTSTFLVSLLGSLGIEATWPEDSELKGRANQSSDQIWDKREVERFQESVSEDHGRTDQGK